MMIKWKECRPSTAGAPLPLLLPLLLLVGFAGCSQQRPSADPAAESSTQSEAEPAQRLTDAVYRDAVAEIAEINAQIKLGFAENDRWSVRSSLHHLGNSLRAMQEAVATSGLPQEQKERTLHALSELYIAFGEIDAWMLGCEGTAYHDASPRINRNLDVLIELWAMR